MRQHLGANSIPDRQGRDRNKHLAAVRQRWRWVMSGWRSRTGMAAAGLLGFVTLLPARVATQEQFQFVVAARESERATGHRSEARRSRDDRGRRRE
jgi:hypothetical protein